MTDRFSDPGATVYDFGDEFLVVCPACSKRAVVRVDEAGRSETARLICPACGHAKLGQAQRFATTSAPQDWYFGLPLWLCTHCLGRDLWARNAEHLTFLEEFVSAKLRERPVVDTTEAYYSRNRHLSSRLPEWIKESKNRKAVLRGLAELRSKLP